MPITEEQAKSMAARWFVHGDAPKAAAEAAQSACTRFGGCSEVILGAYSECVLALDRKALAMAEAAELVHIDGDLTREELVELMAQANLRLLLAGETDDLERLR